MSCTCQLIHTASLHSTVGAGYVVSFAHCTLQSLTPDYSTGTANKSQLLIAIGIHVSLHIPILYHLGDCNGQWANGTRKPETTVHTYSQSYTRTVVHTYSQSYTRTVVHTCSRTHVQSCTHTVVHTYSRTHVQSYTRTVVHTYSRTHVQSYTHTVVHTYSMLAFTSHRTNEPIHSLA